ncbi:11747_t:CDS:10 [Ambispora gerdemannii]|uniref:11747_t:CDS:1 n=1 Tax=Ambispora gerdemannii TaxID=144530 RepID=A0A9N8V230_9GLOM|nr:11747_t:CDS:10 [Ambispora gerdemannii]
MSTSENISATRARLQRRRVLLRTLKLWIPHLRYLLFAIGVGWLFILPSNEYNKYTYISENALLPGQVNTYYSWPQVHEASVYRDNIETLSTSSIERTAYIESELRKAGIKTGTQNFTVNALGKEISGVNVFGVLSAPRGDGTEALVLSAPWISKDGKTVNINGVAAILSIGKFFQSTDIIILITDGGEAGVQAWLEAYHDNPRSDILSSPLFLRSGAIQAAVNLDLPGTKDYQVLGIFYEGVNGQLPNLDLINTIVRIVRISGRIPITLHDTGHVYWANDHGDYYSSLYNLILTMKYQALGHSTGGHGLFFRYKIDAVTLYGHRMEASHQPFMFLEIGTAIESTFRSLNNLLEHLHQSFFFYLLPSPEKYISIGSYLPPSILLAHPQSSKEPKILQKFPTPSPFNRRPRRILFSLTALIATHATGIIFFFMIKNYFLLNKLASFLFIQDHFLVLALIIFISIKVSFVLVSIMEKRITTNNQIAHRIEKTNDMNSQYQPQQQLEPAADWIILKCFTLAFTGMIISCLSVLNFSLAVFTALIVIIPFSLFRPHVSKTIRYLQLFVLCLISPPGLLLLSGVDMGNFLRSTLMEYQLLGNYIVPFVCCLYWPNVLAYTVIVQAPIK